MRDLLKLMDAVKFIAIVIALIIFIKLVISKTNTSKIKKLFIVILIIALVWILFFSVDYIRVKQQKLPIFCFNFFDLYAYRDGGTVEYIGFGYKVIDFHKLVYGEEQWYGKEMVEEKYICPWNVSYEEALKDIEEKQIENKK